MFEHAGEEAQQLGALAGVEIAGVARAEDEQRRWRAAADGKPDKRIGAHQARGGAEYGFVAVGIVAQQDLLPGTEHAVDTAIYDAVQAVGRPDDDMLAIPAQESET